MKELEDIARAIEAAISAGFYARATIGSQQERAVTVESANGPVKSTHRTRAFRERQRERLGTLGNASAVSPSQTLPIHQEGSDLQKVAENKADPEEASHNLPVSTGARATALTVPGNASGTLGNVPVKRSKRERRGPLWHFVPADWSPKDSHRTLALGLLVDVELEAAAFRDHEFNPPRSDADRAFSGWLRRANEYKRRNGGHGRNELVERSLRIIREEKASNGAAHGTKVVKGIFR